MPGELQQTPADQQADRQAADVAEKDLRHRPVERREAEHRAEQRRGEQDCRCRKFAEPAKQNDRAGDRHDLGRRHQVQPVHEVDQVHEPQARQQQQGAFEPERAGRNDPQVFGRGKDHHGDGCSLQQEPRQHRNRTDVVGKAHGRDKQRRAENGDGDFGIARADERDGSCGNDQRGRNDRDARALRGRNAMRRARIRLCQCDPQEQRPDRRCHDARQQSRRGSRGKRQQ